MSYTKFTGLTSPTDIIKKMRDFLKDKDWDILNDCTEDVIVDNDNKKDGGLVLAVRKGSVHAVFRTACGYPIFDNQKNTSKGVKFKGATGIGLTSCSSYTPLPSTGYWFDQEDAPRDSANKQVVGVGIGMPETGDYTLWCNIIESAGLCVMFTIEIYPNVYQHLAFGEIQKVGTWSGGTFISGSKSSYDMFETDYSESILDKNGHIMFGYNKIANTYVLCDVDAAPENGIYWAAACAADAVGATGKILASQIMDVDLVQAAPKVPHYGYFQSQKPTDFGRNINTLNCITVNLPLAMFVQRDPNSLMNFSMIGYIPGIYAVSLRNTAPTYSYEINYSKYGNLHQVFPHVRKKGRFGYDGIAIMQEVSTT